MILFNGHELAQTLEVQVKNAVDQLRVHGINSPQIDSIVFREDSAGLIYTRLKSTASQRAGINYVKHEYSLSDDQNKIIEQLIKLEQDTSCTAVLIQKPRRHQWMQVTGSSSTQFGQWWSDLVTQISSTKDVDGLRPSLIDNGYQKLSDSPAPVWPATAQAVWLILNQASQILNRPLTAEKVAIVGISELLGLPLAAILQKNSIPVDLLSHHQFDQLVSDQSGLRAYSAIVSATGQEGLITGNMLSPDSILLDVGEPKPDFDFNSVKTRAAFLTPVPGGVGPVTVVCLLQNAVDLSQVKPTKTS